MLYAIRLALYAGLKEFARGARIVLRPGLALVLGLVLFAACDGLFPGPDDFEPSGTPFYLNSNIELVAVSGKDQGFPGTGTFPLSFNCRSRTGSTETDLLPAGLLFASTKNRTQHMLLLKPQAVSAPAGGGTTELGAFCCNEFREVPRSGDTFELGPVTDNSGLVEIANLVQGKDISGSLWMVQRAVWLVTDSTGLTQAYRDSLASLPSDVRLRE